MTYYFTTVFPLFEYMYYKRSLYSCARSLFFVLYSLVRIYLSLEEKTREFLTRHICTTHTHAHTQTYARYSAHARMNTRTDAGARTHIRIHRRTHECAHAHTVTYLFTRARTDTHTDTQEKDWTCLRFCSLPCAPLFSVWPLFTSTFVDVYSPSHCVYSHVVYWINDWCFVTLNFIFLHNVISKWSKFNAIRLTFFIISPYLDFVNLCSLAYEYHVTETAVLTVFPIKQLYVSKWR